MIDVDVVLSGAGSFGCAEEGILSILRRHFNIVRIGGASAGAINAAALALNLDAAALWKKFLTAGDLEDWKIPAPLNIFGALRGPGYGMMYGDKIYEALKESIGDVRMGDIRDTPCRIVVGNLNSRKTQIVDSTNPRDQNVKVVDALRCSLAVPFVIDSHPLLPASIVRFTDGGTGANAPSGLWDDDPRPTILIKSFNDETPSPIKSFVQFVRAFMDLRQDASNGNMASNKCHLEVIEFVEDADSLSFNLTAEEVDRRRKCGIEAAIQWVNSEPKIFTLDVG